MATSHKGGRPKFGNKPDPGATIKVPNLSGFSLKKADEAIYKAGYKRRGDMIRGRYIEYRHLDGSKIWIRPNGEIVRGGPKIQPDPNKRAFHPRYDYTGQLLPPQAQHHTGEFVKRS